MSWRRRREGENPAWPGLVEVFAFTLVLVMILGSGNYLQQEKERLEKEVNRLKQENAEYKLRIQQLQAEVEDLNKRLKQCTSGIIEAMKVALEDLSKNLKPKAETCGFDLKFDRDSPGIPEIRISGKPPIYFDTARYDLSPDDKERLGCLAPSLYEHIAGKPFYVLINGTADPRELRGRGVPPRDNTELSALRATGVSALLTAHGLGKHLRVVGLGVKGDEGPLAPDANPDEVFRKYRTVDLVIRVDTEKWMQPVHDSPSQAKEATPNP